MHRVDAQLAAGAPTPIEAELAADGIDELLSLVGTRPPAAGSGETIHLHCTDVEGEWMIRLGADGLEVTREHAKGDVAVRGTASALLCWTMGRGSDDGLEVFGDALLVERWREIGKF
jgi:predicted lipid carrier protein YhbT